MTIIHDLDEPVVVKPQEQFANPKANRSRILVALGLSALTLTCINLLAAARLYQVSTDVSVLESRLEQLSSFEKRLIDKIDLVNAGLQNQFDQLNSSFDTRFANVSESISQLKHSVTRMNGQMEGNSFASLPSPVDFTDSQVPQETAADEPMVIAAPSQRKVEMAVPSLSPFYRRFETANGKVTYRKIR